MNIRFSSFIISTFLLSFYSVGSTAFAYSMPFGENKPQPILTTLNNSRIGLNIHILTNGTSLGHSDRTEIIGIAYTMLFEVFSKPARKLAVQPKKSPQ